LSQAQIDLNSPEVFKKITANPSDSEYDMLMELDIDEPNADLDMKVYAKNP